MRKNSVFDVAAAAAPVRQLDEHFRSGAHLFDFVGRHLYDDAVLVATLTPATDGHDRIAVTRLDAARTPSEVVAKEVEWVLDRLAGLRAEGAASVGVISPFRAQADAIQDLALRDLGVRGIRDLGLRVGTVHAFQGMERDVVLVPLGVGRGDGAGTWRFAGDPNLVAVMATRARERIEWVLSAEPPVGSLLAACLEQADAPPPAQRGIAADAPRWARVLAGHLAADPAVAGGPQVSAPYRSGRHVVDLCLAEEGRFLGVEAALHPDGSHAHVRRHVELTRNGWPLVTALEGLWADRPAELALLLCRARDERGTR